MSEEIYPVCTDEGELGVKLDVLVKPKGCPGLGGWKKSATGGYWTRLKGELAEKVWKKAKYAPGNVVTLKLEGGVIIEISV